MVKPTKLFLLIAPLMILASCAGLGRPTPVFSLIGIESAEQEMKPVDLEYYLEKYPEENAVFQLNEVIYEHFWNDRANTLFSMNKNWHYHEIERRRYVVLNPDDETLTRVQFYGKMNEFFALVRNPGEEIRRYDKTAVVIEKDENGYLRKEFIVPDVKKGCLIDMGYDVDYYPAYGVAQEIVLQLIYPVERFKFELHYPKWWNIIVKNISADNPLVYRTETDDSTKLTTISYNGFDVPSIKQEPFSPFPMEFIRYFKYDVISFSMGYVNYKRPDNWTDIGGEFEELFYVKNKDRHVRKFCRDKANEITGDCTTDLEKLHAIMNFMEEKVKLDEAEELQDSYAKMITRSKANSFDYTCLTKTLMENAELDVDYFVAHSAMSGYFDRDFVSYDEMDYLGLLIRIDGEDLVISPYIKDYPLTFVPKFLQGQPALRISDSRGIEMVNLPTGDNSYDTYVDNYEITIEDDGIMRVIEDVDVDGTMAYNLHKGMKDIKEEDMKAYFADITAFDASDIAIDNYDYFVPENDFSRFHAKLVYNIDNLVSIMPEEIILQTEDLLSPVTQKGMMPDSLNRLNPISIYYRTDYKKKIVVNYPKDWILADTLGNFEFFNTFGSHWGEVSLEPGRIIIEQTLMLNKNNQSKEKIGELVELLSGSHGLDIPALIFEKGIQGE